MKTEAELKSHFTFVHRTKESLETQGLLADVDGKCKHNTEQCRVQFEKYKK